jgi:hypothetical protein
MSPAWYKFLADAVVIFHFAFVGFVLFGGLLALRWRRVIWAHLPCVAWGIWIELSHGLCPLTPLENRLREHGGADTYAGGFVDHYIMPILYPDGLTHETQVAIACLIIAINGGCYGFILWKWYQSRRQRRFAPQPVTVPAPAPATSPVAPPAPDAAPSPDAPARADEPALPV